MKRNAVAITATFVALLAASFAGPPAAGGPSTALDQQTTQGSASTPECDQLLGRPGLGAPPPPQPVMGPDTYQAAKDLKTSAEEVLAIEKARYQFVALRLYQIDPGYADEIPTFSLPVHEVYQTSSVDTSAVRAALERAGLLDVVQIETVPFSECQVQTAMAEASHLLDDWPHGARPDMARGVIHLVAADMKRAPLPDAEAIAQYEAAVAPIPVEWNAGGAVAYEGQLGGGHGIYNICTAGFVVSQAADLSLNRRISMAGHCVFTAKQDLNGDIVYEGRNITAWGTRAHSGSTDARAMRADPEGSINWIAHFYDGSGDRDVNSRTDRGDMRVNDHVCAFGNVTFYKCGYIFSKTETAGSGDVSSPASTYIGVEPPAGCTSACNMGDDGDSGGPWFQNNSAWGLHQGGVPGGNDAIFMAQNYLSNIGVLVTIHG